MLRPRLTTRIKRCQSSPDTEFIQRGQLANVDDRSPDPLNASSKETVPEKCCVTFASEVPMQFRTRALGHGWLYCRMCGVVPGDIDDFTGQQVKFHVSHIVNKNLDGKDTLSNLRALCSTCKQGAKSLMTERPTWIWLLSQIRRAGQDEQLAALNWLREKFDKTDRIVDEEPHER